MTPPDVRSSTNKSSCLYSTTTLFSSFLIHACKCSINVGFRINGLGEHRKGRVVNLKILISTVFTFFTQCYLKAPRSSLLTPICRNACLTSPRDATLLRKYLIRISCNKGCRAFPVSRQSFSDGWLLLSFAEAYKREEYNLNLRWFSSSFDGCSV